MTTILAIAGLAALFVVFGLFRPGVRGGCGSCSCEGDSCQLDDDLATRTRST
jgi:hypothetical protein